MILETHLRVIHVSVVPRGQIFGKFDPLPPRGQSGHLANPPLEITWPIQKPSPGPPIRKILIFPFHA